MKYLFAILSVALLIVLSATAQQDMQSSATDQRHEHVMQMLADTATMRLMIGHIADHQAYRREMLRELVRRADRDSLFRQELLREWLEDAELRQTLERALERGRGELHITIDPDTVQPSPGTDDRNEDRQRRNR